MAVTSATLRFGRSWLDPAKYDDLLTRSIAEAELRLDVAVLGTRYDLAVEHLAMTLVLNEPYFREKSMSLGDGEEYHQAHLDDLIAVHGPAYRVLP